MELCGLRQVGREPPMLTLYMAAIETDVQRSKFEDIYNEYRGLMFYAAYQILHSDQDAEDAVHLAFEKIIEILDKIETVKCPQTKSLVVTIVERKAIDLYRRKKRLVFLPLDEQIASPAAPTTVEAVSDRVSVAQAIAALPPKYRALLLLKYDSGYSDREIGQMLSMSAANVKKTIQRAKARLSQILEEQEEIDDTDHG